MNQDYQPDLDRVSGKIIEEALLKNYCASCHKEIKNNWVHYETYGNYCRECCNKASHKNNTLYDQLKRENKLHN